MASKNTMTKIVIKFDLSPVIEERTDYWSAFLPGFGISVYARDRSALLERTRLALEVWGNNFAPYTGSLAVTKIREYLDRHGIKHTVSKEPLRNKKVSEGRWLASGLPLAGAGQEFAFATA